MMLIDKMLTMMMMMMMMMMMSSYRILNKELIISPLIYVDVM